VATSLVAEILSGCNYTCIILASLNLGIEILMNGNTHCQNLFMWHLKAITPSEAAKFFRSFYDSFLDTAHGYAKLYRQRVEVSAKLYFVGDTPDAEKWPHEVFSNADKAREASSRLLNISGRLNIKAIV
jgi:hypothetical protein